eukprot:TRINITY_DN6832_c0_g3_i2.p1 TRINITY_DN6832_c0_g3~~TRINITY_DN6832_c0_g3_i2.p1  ORF type:complete len:1023 (+),score=225.37 TRINITY_DN6832_c0_g3_i2:269-3070(+)
MGNYPSKDSIANLQSKDSFATSSPSLRRRQQLTQTYPSVVTHGERVKQAKASEVLSNPSHPLNRQRISEMYNVPMPQKENRPRPVGKVATGRMHKEKLSKPLPALTKENRKDPTAPLPKINAQDMEKQGIFSLTTRGLIPATHDLGNLLTGGNSKAVSVQGATFHHWEDRFIPPLIQDMTAEGANFPSIKLDLLTQIESPKPKIAAPSSAEPTETQTIASPKESSESSDESIGDMPKFEPIDPRSYHELMDTYSLHQFIIRKGKCLDTTPEFTSFKRKNANKWGEVHVILRMLEKLFAQYAVPLAYIDGRQVELLADDALTTPTVEALLRCVVNIGQVAPMIRIPGRRFQGERGDEAAAAKIQATWKMHKNRVIFKHYLQTKSAAIIIQRAWRSHFRIVQTKTKILEAEEERLRAFSAMQTDFIQNWKYIRSQRRILVHIPSLSYTSRQRKSLDHFSTLQNAQMSRLTAVADPNIEVLYVSPFPLTTDMLQYYQKLLEIGGIENADTRYKVIYPENAQRFPDHYSLSTVLYYSPRCLKRIRNYVRGKIAYIVPGVMGFDDIRVAAALNLPILGSHPDTTSAFASKSGSKRIFAAADVNIPPGTWDVDSRSSLISELARLITANIHIPKWLIKLDHEFGGRGHALFDANFLPNIAGLRLRAQRSPEEWKQHENKEKVKHELMLSIESVIGEKIQINCPKVYSNWDKYTKMVAKYGAVIEACPGQVLSSPTVNIIIEPDGAVSVLSTHEQVFSQPFFCAGTVFPQTTLPAAALADASVAIGRACFQKNIIGYVGIDFVSLFDEQQGSRRLWAVDLKLRPTNSLANFELFNFVVGGQFDVNLGVYTVPVQDTLSRRYFVGMESLYHENMSVMHYNVLFSLCRSEGIAFDLQEKVGTAFSLLDRYTQGMLGMMYVFMQLVIFCYISPLIHFDLYQCF